MSESVRPQLLLASGSPRRLELLTQLEITLAVRPQDIDETPHLDEAPLTYVARMAREKVQAAQRAEPNALILAADTIVVCDDVLLGKPVDETDASRMLRMLSGRWHDVHTAVAVASAELEETIVSTRVKFRELNSDDLDWYWATGEPADKAGAYGIQGRGGSFVERIDGSYSNVVGLPLVETLAMLTRAGVSLR